MISSLKPPKAEGVTKMRKRNWHIDVGDNSLEVLASEVEELENDELTTREAGFLSGYHEEEEYEEI